MVAIFVALASHEEVVNDNGEERWARLVIVETQPWDEHVLLTLPEVAAKVEVLQVDDRELDAGCRPQLCDLAGARLIEWESSQRWWYQKHPRQQGPCRAPSRAR